MKKYIFVFLCSCSLIAQAKPGDDTEMLVMSYSTDVKKDGSSAELRETVEKVLTESGRTKVSIAKVNFYKSEQNFKLIEAYTLTQGRKSVVTPDLVTIRNSDNAKNGISDLLEAVVQFNNVRVGTEVHLRYELSASPRNGGIYSTLFGITNERLAKKEIYKYSSETPFLTAERDFGVYYTVKKSSAQGRYSLVVEPTADAYALEGSRIETALVSLTTATSWKQLREFEAAPFEKVLSKKLPQKYEDIINAAKDLKDPKEIFNKVALELSKVITYSGDWQSRMGRTVPKIMAAVVHQGKGDCKDYTTGMVAILRRLGFDANPFLTFRSQFYEGPQNILQLSQVPNPSYFNHVIVHIKGKDGRDWWVDPTNPYVQADNMTSDILGNFGLLLDSKSEAAMILPSQNLTPSDFNLEQTLQLSADNTLMGRGVSKMSPSSYNMIGMVDRLYGKEGTAKLFAYMLNPTSKKASLEISKQVPEEGRLDFSYHASDWIMEEQKRKLLNIYHPLSMWANRFARDRDIDLGENGKTTLITRIKGQKTVNTMWSNCLMRSQWMDAERNVQNNADEIVVTDTVTVKDRFIPKAKARGDIYDSFLGDIRDCIAASSIYLKFDESLKTPEMLKEEKSQGPLLQVMTSEDADRLYSIDGPGQTRHILLKLVRYYQKQIAENAKTAKAYYRIGTSIARMGYISGEDYVPEYLEEALVNLNQAIQLAEPNEAPQYISKKINYQLFLKNTSAALETFKTLYEKSPKAFATLMAAAKISIYQKKSKESEQWLAAAEKVATTEENKIDYHKLMFDTLYKQKRPKEAIPHQEFLAQKSPDNAWAWHNLAILHYTIGDYDKAIEVELKALEITEFGAAKKTISDSYYEKFRLASQPDGRKVASASEKEDLLLKAIKYDSKNINALYNISLTYINDFIKTKDKLTLSKAQAYAHQAIQAEPKNPDVIALLQMFKSLQTM